jgi:hypothetical protein
MAGVCYKLQRSDAINEREKYGNKKIAGVLTS